MTTTPQTLTLAGDDYVVIPRDEYQRLRADDDEDPADFPAIQRVLNDPAENPRARRAPAPHCRTGTPRARLVHPPRHDRRRAGRRGAHPRAHQRAGVTLGIERQRRTLSRWDRTRAPGTARGGHRRSSNGTTRAVA